MPPWAWGSEVPSDYPELEALSKVAVNAIRNVHGEVFKIGTPYMTLNCKLIYLVNSNFKFMVFKIFNNFN